jgi:hypothetical protein
MLILAVNPKTRLYFSVMADFFLGRLAKINQDCLDDLMKQARTHILPLVGYQTTVKRWE